MTGKERMARACLGKETDCVPFAPMIYQWFWVNKYRSTLPQELDGCITALDALRSMKADLFAKHEAFIVYPIYSRCSVHLEFGGQQLRTDSLVTCLMDIFGPHGNLEFNQYNMRCDTVSTPEGILTAEWVYDEKSGAPYEAKNLWTDFEKEYDKVKALVEDIEFIPDTERWRSVLYELGEDGIAHLRIPPSPLKFLHWLAGPERTIYFMVDYPSEIAEIVRTYEKKRLELVKKVVKLQDTLVFTSGDNMDSLIYTPVIFNNMCGNSFQQIADVIHENGKLLFTHACGQLKKIIKLCATAGVDGMEGMAPPPLGDIGFGEARDLLGLEFVIQGGITCFEEEFTGADVKSSLYSFVKQLFDELPDKRAFIFGSGCCVSPRARYDNLLFLRDACREFGRGG